MLDCIMKYRTLKSGRQRVWDKSHPIDLLDSFRINPTDTKSERRGEGVVVES